MKPTTIKALVLFSLVLFVRPAKALNVNTVIFALSFTGTDTQAQVILNPGVKPIIGHVSDKVIGEVLKGDSQDFSRQFVDVNPANDGRYYLFYDGKLDWRVGIHKNGSDATALHGLVDNVGNYVMFGSYNFVDDVFPQTLPPMFDCCAVGKVTFAKGSFNPTKVAGTFYMASQVTGDMMVLKFKSTGIVTP